MRAEKIVVINDNEEAVKLVQEQLHMAGFFNVYSFFDATQALESAQKISPDLIITDINMPDLDGWQLCKILNSPEYANFNSIPILLLSATHKDANAEQLAREVGASAFLQVPYKYEDLISLVIHLLVSGKEAKHPNGKGLQRKIVIADDDEYVLKALTLVLEEKNYLIETATDGEMAMRTIEKTLPHLVLLDYQMPEKDGLDVLRWLKKKYPETGAVILTAHGSEMTAVNFMKEGADDYIRKPFDIKTIPEICDQVFRKYNIRMVNRQFQEKAMELKISEEKYRGIVNNSSDLIFILDQKGNFTFANRVAERFFGVRPEALSGKPLVDFLHREEADRVRGELEKLKAEDRPQRRFETRFVGKEEKGGGAEIVEVEITAQELCSHDMAGKKIFLGTLGIARDISERKRIQEQLMQAEKLSSIGTLVSGIAHELNNPLTGIIGYSELLQEENSLSESTKTDISRIAREALRCEKIVQNLLTFARKYKMEKGWINVNEVARNTIDLVGYQLRSHNIEAHLELGEGVPDIYGDFHQIQQIFLNIIYNALHAMVDSHKRGSLWIRTQPMADGRVSVAFKNDGPPIRDDAIGKIFDPFFTTKDAGKGTGLGLSIAHGIITDHGGSITAENLVDGVRFTIQFPPPDRSLLPFSPVLQEETEVVRGKDILVVEDEEVIRDLLKRLLLKDGHRVTAVSNGEEALKFVREKPCDLVISDLKMPGMDGISLYYRLSEIRPQLKKHFILITGTIQNEVNQFSEATGSLYLQKPFKQSELRRVFSSIFGK